MNSSRPQTPDLPTVSMTKQAPTGDAIALLNAASHDPSGRMLLPEEQKFFLIDFIPQEGNKFSLNDEGDIDQTDQEEEKRDDQVMALDLEYTQRRVRIAEIIEIMNDSAADHPLTGWYIEQLIALDQSLQSDCEASIAEVRQANNPAGFFTHPTQNAGAGMGTPDAAPQPTGFGFNREN